MAEQTTDPTADALKFIVHNGHHTAGPLTNEASAVDDWQRLTVLVGATITAHFAHELLTALAEVAPDKARELSAAAMAEVEDYDGYSAEMLAENATKLGIPEIKRRPFPATHTVAGVEYDLTKQYRDARGHLWRFLEWDRTEPEFLSLTDGLQMGSIGLAGFAESLPRLIERHGPIAVSEVVEPALV